MAVLEEEIETTVRARDVERAKLLIGRYLREREGSIPARISAAEYYRRLSDYRSALRVLAAEVAPAGWKDLGAEEIHQQIRLARLLNLAGASGYALRIAEKAEAAGFTGEFGRDLVGILLSNYLYERALPYLKALASKDPAKLAYRERLDCISLADCLQGMGNLAEAMALVRRVLAASPEPLVRAIASEAAASYLILAGDLDGASEHLETALASFSPTDSTLDRAYAEKWAGAWLCMKGRYAEARSKLGYAWKLLYRPGVKPEVWVEVLYWLGLCRHLDGERRFPSEWARVVAFPSMLPNRLVARITAWRPVPEELFLALSKDCRGPGDFHLDPMTETESVRKSRGTIHRLAGDHPSRLLSALVAAGVHGLPQYRCYDVLWPDEPFSFREHQRRLEKVVQRLRVAHSPVEWEESHLRLKSTTRALSCTVAWRRVQAPRGAVFLAITKEFSRAKVQEFFSISSQAALLLISEWVDAGWIGKEGTGLRTRYFLAKALPPMRV